MTVKWPVAVVYIGLLLGASFGVYAAHKSTLEPAAPPVNDQPAKDQPLVEYPSELPYRGGRKVIAEPVPTPHKTIRHRIGHRTTLPAGKAPKHEPPRQERKRLHHTGVSCSNIPAVARGLDRNTIINYAPRYGLNSEQTEQVLRCLHK